MATLVLGSIGEKIDLLIRQGAEFGPIVATMTNPDGSPVDLTDCLIRGQIRKEALDTAVVASLTCSITDADSGQYTFGLSHTTTAAIPAGEFLELPDSQYVWDMELVDSAGRVTPLYYGIVQVLREVTR